MPPFEHKTIETAYRRAVTKLIVKVIPKWSRNITSDEWLRHLARLSDSTDLVEMATSLASQMVRWVNVENVKDWREAAEKSQRSQYLYSLLKEELKGSVGRRFDELVLTQASHISDIPTEVAEKLSGEIAVLQQQGSRPETIVRLLTTRFPTLAMSKIKLLSRTGVSSSATLLTRARSEELDLPWFQWYTSEDQRVRPSHRNMNGVLCAWEDLPSPEALIGQKPTLGHYAPGDCPNCRCGPLPLLTIEDVYKTGSERVRVYSHGVIKFMTRIQFTRFSGIESRKAA